MPFTWSSVLWLGFLTFRRPRWQILPDASVHEMRTVPHELCDASGCSWAVASQSHLQSRAGLILKRRRCIWVGSELLGAEQRSRKDRCRQAAKTSRPVGQSEHLCLWCRNLMNIDELYVECYLHTNLNGTKLLIANAQTCSKYDKTSREGSAVYLPRASETLRTVLLLQNK